VPAVQHCMPLVPFWNRNITFCDVSSGRKWSYRALTIKVGTLTRGAKLISSTSGNFLPRFVARKRAAISEFLPRRLFGLRKA
jgi:hypothetical protein